MSDPLVISCLVLFLATLAVVDTRTSRIPNVLTLPAAIVALVLNGVVTDGAGLSAAFAGLLVGLAVFLPFYLMGGFGAGDVKAMAAVGAFLGPKGVLLAAACTLVAGAVAGLFLLVVLGGFAAITALARRWLLRALVVCATQTISGSSPPPSGAAAVRFPYGVAIACGSLAALIWI